MEVLCYGKKSWDKYDALTTHWGKIFQFKDDVGDIKFPLITKVVKFCLSLSEANGSAERTFSQIAHVIRKYKPLIARNCKCLDGDKKLY